MQLSEQVAVVTGASRGIGKAIAIELGRQGITIAGVDYCDEFAGSITQYLKELGLKGQGFVMDVTKQDSIEKSWQEITTALKIPTILVNNAGITRDNLLMRMSQEEWDKVIDTNLTSVFRLCRICIRDMIKSRMGKIVNIASVVAFMGNAGQVNYAAAKAGMVALTKSLAQEVASRNITVNAVAPGFVETDMTKKLSEAQREILLANVPMKKPCYPEDIAKVVAFLISDAADYITGQTIHINGGMYMA